MISTHPKGRRDIGSWPMCGAPLSDLPVARPAVVRDIAKLQRATLLSGKLRPTNLRRAIRVFSHSSGMPTDQGTDLENRSFPSHPSDIR